MLRQFWTELFGKRLWPSDLYWPWPLTLCQGHSKSNRLVTGLCAATQKIS